MVSESTQRLFTCLVKGLARQLYGYLPFNRQPLAPSLVRHAAQQIMHHASRVQVLIRRDLEESAKVLGERIRSGSEDSEVRFLASSTETDEGNKMSTCIG